MAKLLTGTRVYGTANVDNVLTVGNITPVNSTSNTTGSLIVVGGVGILGNTYTGNLVISGSSAAGNGITFADGTRQTTAAVGSGIDQWVRDTANVIIGTDASQNVRLNFSNTRMDISDGVNASQNVRLDYSNTAITIIQGTDVGQNSRMTIIEGTDVSQNVRLDYSNTTITIIQGTDTSQNARMTIIEGTDVTQNTAIAATDGKMQSAYNKANTGGTFAGDVTITGNLVVNGVTTSVNTSTITTSDSLIKLANNNIAGDSVDIGFYGTYNSSGQKYAGLVRQAGSNFFLFKDITTDPTANTLPAGSLTGANTGILNANVTGYITSNGYSLYDYTTSLYTLANTHSNQIVVIQGIDTSQNARMTITDGVDASQNVRLDYSNTAITIIQGTDTSQNARMTITDGVDASQNVRIDYSNTRMTIADGVDVSQNTRIDYSNTAITIIQGTDTSQNTRIDYSNSAITIIQGVDTTQNNNITLLQGYVNAANANIVSVQALANTDYTTLTSPTGTFGSSTLVPVVTVAANGRITNITTTAVSGGGTGTIDQWVRDTANVIIGTDVSQNVRIDYSNTAIGIIQGTDVGQNSRMTIIEGTNASQNVRLDYSNTAITIIQGVDVTQNTRLTVIEGVDVSQNVRLDYSNTALTIAQGVDNSQNTAIAATDGKMTSAYGVANTADVRSSAAYFQANGAFIKANASFDAANVVAGGLTTANARITINEGVDVSQNVRLDYSNTAITIIQGTDVGQNTRIDYSNTAITILQGVNAGQNSNIAFVQTRANTDFTNVSITATTSSSNGLYIPVITVAANGRVTAISNTLITSSGGGSVGIINDTVTNASYFPLMSLSANTGSTLANTYTSNTKLTFNPSTGTLSSTVFNSLSDENKKTNIKLIDNALEITENLNGVTFEWKDNGLPSAGLIAQDVEKYLPQLILNTQDGKSLNYDGVIGVLVEAVKNLSQRVKELENK